MDENMTSLPCIGLNACCCYGAGTIAQQCIIDPPRGGNWDHAGPRERTPSVPAREARMAKKATRRRYTSTEKKRILSIAQKEGLTGADVKKRFGIAQPTFYRWRGPGRG